MELAHLQSQVKDATKPRGISIKESSQNSKKKSNKLREKENYNFRE
jgi:hypothetical protein